jgi:hypothetical protein
MKSIIVKEVCIIIVYHFCDHFHMYFIQHYVIKFVSDLWQVSRFLRVLRFPPPIKLTAWNIIESGVKHQNPNPHIFHCIVYHVCCWKYLCTGNICLLFMPHLLARHLGHYDLPIFVCLSVRVYHIRFPLHNLSSPLCKSFWINVREYRSDNQKWTIQRN